ncbi:MAG: dehydrogenase, partial [Planctomycetes bacterium]|nr:dehydrogenase [Planctomycetota bacterium]
MVQPGIIDFDDFGQGFVCNCVDPHLFHVIQGAHYEPWRNRKSSQYAYQRIATIADHLHFTGSNNVRGGLGSAAESQAGGGHAHSGTMVYLGDNWPDHYRNTVFMNNIHGRRINNDILRRAGSGYTASHGPDLLLSKDPWYMGVTIRYGPDGAVFVSDWSDTGECHDYENTHKQDGRIFKVMYGRTSTVKVNVGALSDEELVRLQLHKNDWYVRHARRVLQERAAAGKLTETVHKALKQILRKNFDTTRKLRALWALHVTGGLDEEQIVELLDSTDERLRVWSIRLELEDRKV